jgi:pimeloyl-ACP methyl ester carboxylesterase
MPAFFVHGVPETGALWDDLRAALGRDDVVAPSLPGFGVDLPDGFTCTKDGYLEWLIGEVEGVGAPVDIVGHDWGSLLVQRLVAVRPDLVRSWAAGSAALDPEYEWHPTAKIWQTPGQGEAFMQAITADAIVPILVNDGASDAQAREVAARIDDRMKSCILPLYRSATDVGREWGALDRRDRPALVLWGTADAYVGVEFGKRLAERTGARLVLLEGGGHWWPLQFAERAAAELRAHWAAAGN